MCPGVRGNILAKESVRWRPGMQSHPQATRLFGLIGQGQSGRWVIASYTSGPGEGGYSME